MPLYELEFRKKLDLVISRVKGMLEQEIRPIRMDEESHQYDDKFALANLTTDLALDTVTTLLDTAFAGVGDKLEKKESNIKYELKFEARETCVYALEREREIAGPKVTVAETKRQSRTFVGGQSTKQKEVTTQVTTRVKEFVWTHTLTYSAKLVDRKDRSLVETLVSGTRSRELTTTAKEHSPRPALKESAPLYLDLEMIKTLPRSIDRSRDSCKTPRRNQEIDDVFSAFQSLATFTRSVSSIIINNQRSHSTSQKQEVKNFFSPAACCFL
uniref:Uncharacterized protein n=1 Tax=Aureoumbra lagunensis TaxID=44058 RepID=A0A7S3NJ51_9STRA